MENKKQRGMLTDEVQSIAKSFLGREIDIRELRLYPYLDYCLKNNSEWNLEQVKDVEVEKLNILQTEKHVMYGISYFRCTREFYDYLQNVLALSYVPDFININDFI